MPATHLDYLFAPDLMVSATTGTVYRLIKDARGSVRLVVNMATGAIVQQINYDEFGNATVAVGWQGVPSVLFQPFGFAGGLFDLYTGLVRFGVRDYDAVTGRWTSKDPLRFGGGQTNLYVYAGNDPMNGIDPTGEGICPLPPPSELWLFVESRGRGSCGVTAGHGRRDAEGEEAPNPVVVADGIGGHEAQLA